jgi:putative Mg2+ transporter-C (MgtC) family protein
MTSAESWTEPLLRLIIATAIGALLGINRKLHDKPLGLRTLGLVSLGSCALTLSVERYALTHGADGVDAASRAAQGIVSGIGFLGAGVILRGKESGQVRNLTTAATIWISSALGVACALEGWPVVGAATVLTFVLLVFGKRLERDIGPASPPPPDDPDT